MYTQELVKEAKKFAGIKPDTIIDEEERYYNRGAIEKYEAFLAGANCAYNEFINKACEWLEENIDLVAMDTVNAKSGYHEIVMMNDFERKFREAMEE